MSAELVEIIVDVCKTDLNIHNPYSLTEIGMATELRIQQEKGVGSSGQGLSPTYSGSPHPPKIKIGKYWCVELTCDTCNKKFFRHISVSYKLDEIYCSMKCRWEHLRVKVGCNRCGKDVYLTPSQYKRSRTKLFYCNRECYVTPLRNCDWCGETIHRRYQHGGAKHFCSDECYGTWLSLNKMGDKNPNWKGGISINYYGGNWLMQRRKAKRRDNYTCQDCGKKHNKNDRLLHVHHVKPFKFFENYKEANRLENLISLCYSCHVKVEANINV